MLLYLYHIFSLLNVKHRSCMTYNYVMYIWSSTLIEIQLLFKIKQQHKIVNMYLYLKGYLSLSIDLFAFCFWSKRRKLLRKCTTYVIHVAVIYSRYTSWLYHYSKTNLKILHFGWWMLSNHEFGGSTYVPVKM